MRSSVLLHIVFSSERLVACGAEGVLLSSMLLSVPRRVAGSGEEVSAPYLLRHRTRILILLLCGLLVRRSGDS